VVESDEGSISEVSVLLNFSENDVGGEGLDGVVELVAHEVAGCALHVVMGPVLESVAAISDLVVFNQSKSLLEDVCVKEGVECVLRSAH